jgi:hypothetical protein
MLGSWLSAKRSPETDLITITNSGSFVEFAAIRRARLHDEARA